MTFTSSHSSTTSQISISTSTPSHFRFLDLPPELRSNVYEHLLRPEEPQQRGGSYIRYKFDLAIFGVNHTVHDEAVKIFRQMNVFARIETPWDQAEQHVAIEGNVPIIATGIYADNFYDVHLRVVINAPNYAKITQHDQKFIVLAEDLLAFTKMWTYSDLSYGGDLNSHLCLTLHLQNPLAIDTEQPQQLGIPNSIQRKLLLPFAQVRGLREMQVEGDHNAAIAQEMRDGMAIPYDRPETCLEEATKLKDAGNEQLITKQAPHEAIKLYVQAFKKIHIICNGRRRSIRGDAWFDIILRDGTFEGRHGQMVRMILRIRLVANMVKAYLDLEDWKEAHFWGMRTINLMRQGMDDEDTVMIGFPAAPEVGKIYYRTGLAAKRLGDDSEARRLLRVAQAYRPNDPFVDRELRSVALMI
ncbi:hypothetical protein EJ08DRAFT_607426 [Tothia fuscella]|uniref:Uncharacterized protein n=1 Tax=Tothia fuscella TaxID=1048955 RepID=A0A9P4NYT3_9PEZI|nr:hypothetical protein EJ08DRAFT_607426 [Tothia fuscella]